MNRSKGSAALLWLAILSLGLTACTEHKPVPPPDVKLNPSPMDHYEITITMEDAPEQLKQFSARIQYNIKNKFDCVPVDHTLALGGVTPQFNEFEMIEFMRSDGNVFKADVFTDAMRSENYYGLGVCHWGITGIHAALDQPDNLLSRLEIGDPIILSKEGVEKRYCLRSEYPGSQLMRICTSVEGVVKRGNPEAMYFIVTTESRGK